MKKVVFIIASVLLLTGCSKELGLPTVKLSQDGITADNDHCTINIKAAVTDQGSSDVHDFGICYTTGSNNHPTVSDPHLRLTSDNMEAIEALLENAEDGTTYYFRAYATNGEGTAYSDIVSFSFSASVYYVNVEVVLEGAPSSMSNYCHVYCIDWDNYYALEPPFKFHYGDTTTIYAYSQHPDIVFSHWDDGSTSMERFLGPFASDVRCTAYFQYSPVGDHLALWDGVYTCYADAINGQQETWDGVRFEHSDTENVLLGLGGSEGLNLICDVVVENGLEIGLRAKLLPRNDLLYASRTFVNDDGITCYAVPCMVGSESWITEDYLYLYYYYGSWEFLGSLGGDRSVVWIICNAATGEEIGRTEAYKTFMLIKEN